MSSACNCCEEPPCEAPVLQFISVTGSPCGFALPPHPDNTPEDAGLRFGTRTSTYTKVYDRTGTVVVDFVEVDYDEDGSTTETFVETIGLVAGECVEGEPTSSDVDSYHSVTTLGDGRKYPEITTNSSSGFSGGGACSGSVTTTTTYESDPADPGDTETSTDEYNFCYAESLSPAADWNKTLSSYSKTVVTAATGGFDGSDTETWTVAFSDPLTDVVFPEWPAWPGESEATYTTGQGNLDTAARSYDSQTKIKWRLRHFPSGTCYLKAWVRKTFTPAPTTPPADPLPDPTITDPTITVETYEWIGTGNPCITDPLKAYNHDDNRITATENEVLPPAELGETLVELLKFSCVEGYEPDISDPENPQPNGFPDPEWEASPP